MEAVTKLLGVVVWPGIVLVGVLVFRRSLTKFLDNLGELSFKGAGLDVTAKRREEAAFYLGAAEGSKSAPAGGDAAGVAAPASAPQVLSAKATRSVLLRAEETEVLWVDDNPKNNVNERRALESLGMEVTLALSTEEGMERLRGRPYDLVISDMKREGDDTAGYTLLRAMGTAGIKVPVILYSGYQTDKVKEQARQLGAVGCANRADELLELVLGVVKRG